ncbi:MAG: hypothetical protein KatS3mg105_0882 [Gemmatales bacterium]|nr:MAG: hypothetical protein KatS3mg105_0882 [Gemmatales bacterium]
MRPDVVVDIGNTFIKWGRCLDGGIAAKASLDPNDDNAWERQCRHWQLPETANWAVSGVHPERVQRLVDWLKRRGQRVRVLDSLELPLQVDLDHPEWVGIDRLLNGVAANHRRHPDNPAVVIDAGSAVTVDWIDANGAFAGGIIFPGIRLMADTLHRATALLPPVQIDATPIEVPAKSTPDAMRVGVVHAVAGGTIMATKRLLAAAKKKGIQTAEQCHIFVTGGDASLLAPYLSEDLAGTCVWPEMTLEGARLSCEACT